jgi:signal transduction histidine kinase
MADRVQLQQVIINLMMNGLESMEEVTGRARELVIRTEPHDAQQIRISVEDSGVGVDAGDLDRLFTAFYTTKAAGMGLGLSISRSIIESHGGKLWATANPHHGATFHFTLPIIPIARGARKQLRLDEAVWSKVLPRLNQSPTEPRPRIR